VCVAVVALSGCGGSTSMSDRVSDNQDVKAVCVKAGVQEIAAERTRVYRCSWSPLAGRTTSPCYADLDGDLVDVTNRADVSFGCSHVAAIATR